jgi:carbonic anhydrase
MKFLRKLFENNWRWASQIEAEHPGFFETLASQQAPEFLWIGCSDSRVPANEIVGLLPGEVFVHRNVANLVVHTDLNCLSVLQYAVDVLKVQHVIVCGHYGCGGVRASQEDLEHGLIDNWLRHISDVSRKHEPQLQTLRDEEACLDRLCELNVIEQVYNICQTTIVQSAWKRSQPLVIHGWIYSLHDGLLRDLNMVITGMHEMTPTYNAAISGESKPRLLDEGLRQQNLR